MPILQNTQMELVANANTVMASAFFPRARKWVYPRLCGSTVSTRMVEPFVVGGAAPLMQLYKGRTRSRGIPSFKFNSPNLLFKNYLGIKRSAIEMDQTGTVLQYAQQVGLRVAEHPEYLFAKRLLKAAVAGSQTVVYDEDGQSYTITVDGKPFFATDHDISGSNQSNVVQGTLPNTVAGIDAQDMAMTAQQLIRDFSQVLNAFQTFKDNTGAPINPTLEPEESVVVVVPPVLKPAAQLAFKTAGQIGGATGTGGSSGGTTNIKLVKDVISSGLFAGVPDVESDTLATVSPVNPTDWYAFVVDDLVKPFYSQLFRPKAQGEYFPLGYDPEAAANKIISEADSIGVKISRDQANLYAATVVEHNLSAMGANAQASVVEGEEFFISGRARGNFVYGPWFTGVRVKPSGGT